MAELYDDWIERVHTLVCWILRDADAAAEVVEETFWQAWRTAARHDESRSSGASWLILIARSRAIDRLRSRRSHSGPAPDRLPSGTTWQEALGEASQSLAGSERSEEAARLAEALLGLESDEGQALELAFFDGLSHGEIAARTGQQPGAVKAQIHLAMKKLRQHFGF